MKLLFDQNLSPHLVQRLADLFPQSVHVLSVSLDAASDNSLWNYARDNAFTILTKDEDFNDLVTLRGIPPKILWLQLGNCTTDEVEAAIRSSHDKILAFNDDPEMGTLVLR